MQNWALLLAVFATVGFSSNLTGMESNASPNQTQRLVIDGATYHATDQKNAAVLRVRDNNPQVSRLRTVPNPLSHSSSTLVVGSIVPTLWTDAAPLNSGLLNYTFQVRDANGNPMPGIRVLFKFNGAIFTQDTNGRGMVVFQPAAPSHVGYYSYMVSAGGKSSTGSITIFSRARVGSVSTRVYPKLALGNGSSTTKVAVIVNSPSHKPIQGAEIQISTTLGTLLSKKLMITNEKGEAFAIVSSSRPGVARLLIHAGSIRKVVKISFTKVPFDTSGSSIPDAVTGIQFTNYGHYDVKLAWRKSPGTDYYVIYRSSTAAFDEARIIGETHVTSFNDTGVRPDTQYNYWIKTENRFGESKMPVEQAYILTPPTWNELHKALGNSIVLVSVSNKYAALKDLTGGAGQDEGTGWFSPGGYIVTCYHVVQNADNDPASITVRVNNDGNGDGFNGQVYDAKVVDTNPAKDLALLRLTNAGAFQGQALSIGPSPYRGEPVAVLGHPGGFQLTMTTGAVTNTGIQEKVSDYGLLSNMTETDVASVPGNSGSPLLNQYGQVVGIMESTNVNNGNNSYAVRSRALKAFGIKRTDTQTFTSIEPFQGR